MTKSPVLYPALYVLIVVGVLCATYVFKLRTQGVFACTTEGYRADRYLGYCDADAYGDYDHGAVWFGLEPEVTQYAGVADVLFLGSSRMQFAFSTLATDKWFADNAATHYLLGFTHTENVNFARPLLSRIQPSARVFVINVDRFFADRETGPASEILHDPGILTRYKQKYLWQQAHRKICGRVPAVCGKKFGYFRARKSGHWVGRGVGENNHAPVADAPPIEQDQWDHNAAIAKKFVASLPVQRDCVLMTIVPYPKTRAVEAETLAKAVGVEFIRPTVEGLRTFDGSHLDGDSAQRWSQAFFELAGPRIKQCLGGEAPASS